GCGWSGGTAGAAASATAVTAATSSTTRSWSWRQTPRLRAREPPADEEGWLAPLAGRVKSRSHSTKRSAAGLNGSIVQRRDEVAGNRRKRTHGGIPLCLTLFEGLAVAIQPSRALGYPDASRKRALLTRSDRVRDVERSTSKSASRPGILRHTRLPAAAASASA